MSSNALDRFRPRPTRGRLVYTVQEVADMLALGLGGTYTLIREGTIPALKMGGRWVVPKNRSHIWLDGVDDQADDVEPEAPPDVPATRWTGRRRSA
jgi:excisionase family DNA binding protein